MIHEEKFISLNGKERFSIAILYGYRSLYETDKDNYEIYKKGVAKDIPEENLLEMKVLDTLDKLGFPMDNIGTYFYKDVIMGLKPYLERMIKDGAIEVYDCLKTSLDQKNSALYLNVSRGQNDMPLEHFHIGIASAIKSIDNQRIDKKFAYQIFGDSLEERSYGDLAIIIGLYSFGMRSLGDYFYGDEIPKIKMVTNYRKLS